MNPPLSNQRRLGANHKNIADHSRTLTHLRRTRSLRCSSRRHNTCRLAMWVGVQQSHSLATPLAGWGWCLVRVKLLPPAGEKSQKNPRGHACAAASHKPNSSRSAPHLQLPNYIESQKEGRQCSGYQERRVGCEEQTEQELYGYRSGVLNLRRILPHASALETMPPFRLAALHQLVTVLKKTNSWPPISQQTIKTVPTPLANTLGHANKNEDLGGQASELLLHCCMCT